MNTTLSVNGRISTIADLVSDLKACISTGETDMTCILFYGTYLCHKTNTAHISLLTM